MNAQQAEVNHARSEYQRTELKTTTDGSHTLYVPAIDETYHSTFGAIQESKYIFSEAGLKQCKKQDINILEIGFGTGLNAFITLLEACASQLNIHYTGLELYPVEVAKALQLNYPEILAKEKRELFEKIHFAEWNKETVIVPGFTLTKVKVDFTKYCPLHSFDVIYFDAFSPEKQPEMWTEEQFIKVFNYSNNEAILTTYCAKGSVRRAMQTAGFSVTRLPGPIGKREILRGRKLI